MPADMQNPLRILVIDDDPVMRELLEALLEFAGHAAEVVDSGKAGLARLSSGAAFDVVLTDLHMPGIQGHELAAALLAQRAPGTILLGMSGSFPSEDETRLLDVFLQKPFSIQQFEEAVDKAREHRLAGTSAPRDAASATSESSESDVVLDRGIFDRLAATLPAAQLRGLYDLTLDDVRSRVQRMQAAHSEGDFATVQCEAHSIKGGCGMVGASELYLLASNTEGGISADALPLADFAPACERLQRMLDARFKDLP
jgi:CheY-like chemotaxis protein